MKIVTVSGSARQDSSNTNLFRTIPSLYPTYHFEHVSLRLPLFLADNDKVPYPETVVAFRRVIAQADAIIFATPEYIHGVPAILKNALEWLTTSGELQHKAVLAITFTPHPPRGEKAMQALLWSLQALQARIVGQLPLYQSELKIINETIKTTDETMILLKEAIGLFENK